MTPTMATALDHAGHAVRRVIRRHHGGRSTASARHRPARPWSQPRSRPTRLVGTTDVDGRHRRVARTPRSVMSGQAPQPEHRREHDSGEGQPLNEAWATMFMPRRPVR